jgi:hypothetical protein
MLLHRSGSLWESLYQMNSICAVTVRDDYNQNPGEGLGYGSGALQRSGKIAQFDNILQRSQQRDLAALHTIWVRGLPQDIIVRKKGYPVYLALLRHISA